MSTAMQALQQEDNAKPSDRPTLDFASRFSGYVLGPPISLRAESKTSRDVESDEVHKRVSGTTSLTMSPRDSMDWDSDERRSSTSSVSEELKLVPTRPQIISASSFPLPPDTRTPPSMPNTPLRPTSSAHNSTPSTPPQRLSTPSISTSSSSSPRQSGQATASKTDMNTPPSGRPSKARPSPPSLSYSSRSTSPTSSRLDPSPGQSDHHRFAQSVSMTPISSPSSPVEVSHSDQYGPNVTTPLRSAPGVVGLGEGWAGGPQRKKAKRRWTTRGTAVEANPLVPRAVDEGSGVEASLSPFKAIWNRSMRLFFGASPTRPSESQVDVKEEGSLGEKLKSMFTRSRLNLSFSSGEVPPSKASKGLFSRSQPDLLGSPSSLPPSRRDNAGQRPPFSQEIFARSEPHLSSLPPRRTDSLKGQPLSPISRGRPSPWRPLSSLGALRSQTPSIPEVDEPPASSSSVSLETPMTDDNSPALHRAAQSDTSPGRISLHDSTGAHRLSNTGLEEPGLDTLRTWAEQAGDSRTRSSTPASSWRKRSSFIRQRKASSPLDNPARGEPGESTIPRLSTVPFPSPTNRGPALRAPMSNPTYAFTPDLNYEAPGPPSPIRSTPIDRPQEVHNSSWIALSGETWRKRLSRLSEDDEEQGQTRQRLLNRVRVPSSRSRVSLRQPNRLSASASAPTLSELLHPHLDPNETDREVEGTFNINRWSSDIASLDLHSSQMQHRPTFARGVSANLDGTAWESDADENRSRRYQDPDPVDTTHGIALDLQPPISHVGVDNPMKPARVQSPIISSVANGTVWPDKASGPTRTLSSNSSLPSGRPTSGLTDFTKVVGSDSLPSSNENKPAVVGDGLGASDHAW